MNIYSIKWKIPSSIPNIDGYKFIAFTSNGKLNCRVKKCPITGLHFVVGVDYSDIIGWIPGGVK